MGFRGRSPVGQLRHCLPFDKNQSTGKITVAQNGDRLAKRKQGSVGEQLAEE